RSLGRGAVAVRPLTHLPLIRALVVDMAPFREKMAAAGAAFVPAEGPSAFAPVGRDSRERRRIDPAIECIGCGMCVSACTMVAHDPRFPGPAALNRVFTLLEDSRDAGHARRGGGGGSGTRGACPAPPPGPPPRGCAGGSSPRPSPSGLGAGGWGGASWADRGAAAAPAAPGCAFCRLARGEAPAHVVFEDGATLAFLDHRPLFVGHTLVIPRAHVATLMDLPADLAPALLGAAALVARAVERRLGADR